MGLLVDGSIIILGTLCLVCGISYFIRERMGDAFRYCILLMGNLAALWCYGYGFMG